jgi:glycosyltransferase involved in cell wall biosynthesis
MLASNGECTSPRRNETCFSDGRATVAVVIPTFNHARFLADAIMSVLAQTRPADEIVVVDDGSTDDPAAVVARFENVRLIRQDNRGPSAARNTGLRNCEASYVSFLDADDRFLPTALATGLDCFVARPECAFVYGGYRYISENGQPIGPDCFKPINGDAHLALLHANQIVMHATVLYRRECLLAINGFDEAWRCGEDYDVYLRIVQKHPIASHPEIIAEYRRHGKNVSAAYFRMLKSVLGVLDQHEVRINSDLVARAALQEGKINRRRHYVSETLATAHSRWNEHHDTGALVRDYVEAARWDPILTLRTLLGPIGRRASKVLPRVVVRSMEKIRGRPYS